MKRSRPGIVFAVVLVIGLGALAVSGSQTQRERAFSLEVPYTKVVTTLALGRQACESPIASPSAFAGVEVWAATLGGPGALDVIVRDADGRRTLARGRIAVPSSLDAVSATLNSPVPAHRPVRICLMGSGEVPVTLAGSTGVARSPRLRVGASESAQQISLVLLGARPQSFLSQVPTVFHRAALFRPGWVGTWTFWVLAFSLLAAAGALGAAVITAASADEAG